MISDGYHHFMVWFEKPGELSLHPSYKSDPWKLFYEKQSNLTENKEKDHGTAAAANKSESSSEPKTKPVKLVNVDYGIVSLKDIMCHEIPFRLMKMVNTDEGFTVKKNALALLMHEEIQYLNGGHHSIRKGVENENEEVLDSESMNSLEMLARREQTIVETAKEIGNQFLETLDEWADMSEQTHYPELQKDETPY
ncbi:unnamed protein product [Ambrosiozyma monospora]|uniref:Unnamed protein product n=1 Tax=Ambrosiozyma monospora TaxID=43982 RepID=A0ACB5TUH3_AMBMO|nr:unnamed protein product [Ambrosiozyma monospora]